MQRGQVTHPSGPGVRGQVDHQFGPGLARVLLGRQHGRGVQHADVVHVAARGLGQKALTPRAVGEIALLREDAAALPSPGPASGRGTGLLARREYGQIAARLLAVRFGGGEQRQPALSVVVWDLRLGGLGDGGHGGAEESLQMFETVTT